MGFFPIGDLVGIEQRQHFGIHIVVNLAQSRRFLGGCGLRISPHSGRLHVGLSENGEDVGFLLDAQFVHHVFIAGQHTSARLVETFTAAIVPETSTTRAAPATIAAKALAATTTTAVTAGATKIPAALSLAETTRTVLALPKAARPPLALATKATRTTLALTEAAGTTFALTEAARTALTEAARTALTEAARTALTEATTPALRVGPDELGVERGELIRRQSQSDAVAQIGAQVARRRVTLILRKRRIGVSSAQFGAGRIQNRQNMRLLGDA